MRYLKRCRLCDPSRKQFALLNYTVYLSPDKIFEPLVEPNGDLSTENNVYSNYINSTE